MNSPSAASHPIRSSPLAAIAVLVAVMAVALVLWQVLPRPQSRLVPWIPIVAALLASRLAGPVPVLSLRNIAYAGGAFLLCQAAIQLLLAARIIAV